METLQKQLEPQTKPAHKKVNFKLLTPKSKDKDPQTSAIVTASNDQIESHIKELSTRLDAIDEDITKHEEAKTRLEMPLTPSPLRVGEGQSDLMDGQSDVIVQRGKDAHRVRASTEPSSGHPYNLKPSQRPKSCSYVSSQALERIDVSFLSSSLS